LAAILTSSATGSTREGVGGWPQGIAPPGLPRIRTCATRASGSSSHGFAAVRKTECTTRGLGSANTFKMARMRSQSSRRLFRRLPGCPVVRPRKTRFRLVVSLCRTGYAPAWVPGGVSAFLHRFLLTQALPGALEHLAPLLAVVSPPNGTSTFTPHEALPGNERESRRSRHNSSGNGI
jgi:hypothetical protein